MLRLAETVVLTRPGGTWLAEEGYAESMGRSQGVMFRVASIDADPSRTRRKSYATGEMTVDKLPGQQYSALVLQIPTIVLIYR